MAEETLNNVENLENQPSGVSQLMAQSNFLNPASIEQPLAPQINWPDNFVNTTNYIKDNTSGVSPDYPPSQVRADRSNGVSQGGFGAMLDREMAQINNLSDVSRYAEPYAYDSSPKGTFRARYKAYGQDTFNKVGFHPLIDNETFFNQNTTFGDDLQRWATHSAWPMLSKGFMDPIRSYKSIMDGNGLFDADPESARDYEYYNAIGASSKGGLGGFTVNLLNSASYSMGILTEGAMEGALIGSLFSGGNAATGAIEGSTTFLNKLGALPKALVQTTKATGELLTSVKNYSNLSRAKELYAAAGRNFGNFINPLHNTTQAFHELKNTDNLTNLARSATTAGALWHDVMAMNMALSEGKLEGGFTRYQTYDRLYNQHLQDNNGKAPTLDQQESMMRQASKGAWWNTLNNTALIYYSNKLVFPSITNASFLKGMPKFGFGKVVTNVGKEYQILFQPGKNAIEGAFTKQRVSFVNAIKSLAKPATYGRVGLNYFKANLVEGTQEVLQDVLQEATQNYYVDTFKNPDARNFRYASGLLSESIGKQWSSQGLETFLSGFLMGSILQAPGAIKKYATVGYNDYLQKNPEYQTYLKDREQLADTVVEQMNTMYKNGQYFFDPRISNYANIGLLGRVIDDPDNHTTKDIKDTEFAAFQAAVLSSLQNGTFDMFLKHYEGYKQASPKDLEEAWGLQSGQGAKALERFDKSLESAKQMSTRWTVAKEKMKFMANLDDYKKDTEEYRMAEIYNKAYNQALYNYVFLHGSFDDNVHREKKLYENLSKLSAIKESNFSDIAALTDPNRLQREIEMMKTEVENLENFNTAESIAEASRKRELLELYSNFHEKQENLVDLFINKSILDNIKAEIIKENPDMTDAEASTSAIDKIIEDYDNGRSNEFLDYKESFATLLKGLATTSQQKLQLEREMQDMGGIDELFDNLLDTHVLRNETARVAEYVNLLSNPRDFYEHVMRNFKFMKDLYNNREEIVKEIVNQEISAIENNTLLNTLADQGIYVDLDEFSKWVQDPRNLPESFIDVRDNKIINKGSILYQEYIGTFMRAAQLAEKKPAGDPLSQKQMLDKRVQEMQDERAKLIREERDKYNAKFKDKYGLTEEEYLAQEEQRVAENELTEEDKKKLEAEKKLIISAIEKLASENYVDVLAAAEIFAEKILAEQGVNVEEFWENKVAEQQQTPETKKAIFDKSQTYDVSDIEDQQEAFNTSIEAALKSTIYGKAAADRLQDIENELNKKAAEPTIDVKNTPEYLAYQEAVDEINEKYDNIIADIKDDFKKKGIDENTPDNYTTKTAFDDFDAEFQQEITELFDEYLVDVLQEPIDLKNTNPDNYEKFRDNWLERQGPLIESFNERAKEKAYARAKKLAEPPVLKFIPVKINSQTTTYTISSLVKRFQKFLADGQYENPKKKNEFIQLTPEDIANINEDIAALNGYLNARVTSAEPRNIAEETFEIIQEYVINKQNELVDVVDEDGNVIGRTFRDRGPNDPVPDRTTKVAEEVENELKQKDSFEYSPIKPKVDADGNVGPSPVESIYNQFFNDSEIVPEDRIRLFMEAFKREAFRGWKEFRFQEKLDAVENSLKTVGTYEHLRDTIKKQAFKESADGGDYVDGLIRIFLTPNAATASKFSEFSYDSTVQLKGKDIKISDIMSRKAFDKLFGPVSTTSPGGIVTKFRLGVIDGTYRILSENVKLFDKRLRDGRGVTGEVDLLLLREDGSVAIVDIKTKTMKERKEGLVSGWKDFGNPDAKYESSTYFRGQQSIYGYQFFNSTGITPELKLMPFDMTLSKTKVGYIEDIELAEIVEDGKDTIDLEYLPEIENFGIVKIQPEIKAPTKKTSTTEEEGGEGATKAGIPESDPTKNTLDDNVGKPVMYHGRPGRLVLNTDGSFGVEIVVNDDMSTMQLTLDALQANLILEKEYNNEENIKQLEQDIRKMSEMIKSAEGFKSVFPLQKDGKNVYNGTLTVNELGLQLIFATQGVGQVSTVNGKIINASFSNKEETIATINGVRYDVLRNDAGNITVLSYMTNDAEISKIDKQIGDMAQKIGNLRKSLSTEVDSVKKDAMISRIDKLQESIKLLNGKRVSLSESNKKMFVHGENANDIIFALNRLPNSFQRATKNANKANETQDLKSIENLSLSRTIATTITEILSENYPEVLDTLIEQGVSAIKKADLTTITKWANETIEKLESLGYTVINRGDIVDDINNQINALNALLNDLQSINLTKNGRISKKQEAADQLFGPGQQEVPNRTSVPKNEGTTRKQTTGVSRPATRTELENIVKQAREENLESQLTEEASVPRPASDAVSEAIENISNATLDTIDLVYEEEFLKIKALESSDILDAAALNEAYTERMKELTTIVSIPNVNVGEYLISKNPIFTDISGEIVQVVEIWYGTIVTDDTEVDDRATEEMHVTLKNIKTEETRAFTEAELVENFEKTTMEATQPQPPVDITEDDVQESEESKDVVKDFQKDSDAIANAKAKAESTETSTLWNNLGNNSILC
jgi:hypothetical protein